MSSRDPGRPPRQLPVLDHLIVTSWDDLRTAMEDAERVIDPPQPIRVRWSGDWHAPALLHGVAAVSHFLSMVTAVCLRGGTGARSRCESCGSYRIPTG